MNRAILALVVLLPLIFGSSSHVLAVEPDEILANSSLEIRAREISKGLRCVVCQNQSIDDSHAEIARDLRILVRERLLLGDDNQQVIDYVVARYGEYVLLKPSFRRSTLPLWLGPPVMVLLGLVILLLAYRKTQYGRTKTKVEPFSLEDRARLDALVDQEIARQERAEADESS